MLWQLEPVGSRWCPIKRLRESRSDFTTHLWIGADWDDCPADVVYSVDHNHIQYVP
jgi:hypothetical protein